MFKILIIVPTKDSWLKLPSLINSLKEQTDCNFRVIFIDYKSSKKHYKYLNDICNSDQKYTYIIQSENTGIFGAMNEGLNYAEDNEWVLFWGFLLISFLLIEIELETIRLDKLFHF